MAPNMREIARRCGRRGRSQREHRCAEYRMLSKEEDSFFARGAVFYGGRVANSSGAHVQTAGGWDVVGMQI